MCAIALVSSPGCVTPKIYEKARGQNVSRPVSKDDSIWLSVSDGNVSSAALRWWLSGEDPETHPPVSISQPNVSDGKLLL